MRGGQMRESAALAEASGKFPTVDTAHVGGSEPNLDESPRPSTVPTAASKRSNPFLLAWNL
jgi:hypothetical protein